MFPARSRLNQMLPMLSLMRDDSATESPAIQAELVDMFHRRAPPDVISLNILFSGLLTLLLWEKRPAAVLLGSFAAITLVALANILRHRRYESALQAKTANSAFWRLSYVQGTLANGLVWGLSGAVLYSATAPLQSSFVLLVICGITAAVAAAQASLWHTVLAFSVPALLAPAIGIAIIGEPQQWVVTGLLLFYLVYILFVGHINHFTMVDVVRLRFKNDQLLANLQEREQHFRALVENTPDILTAIAADGTLLFHSPSTEEILGYSAAELKGRSVFALIHPDDRPFVANRLEQLLQTPSESAASETRWRHRDGHWRLLHCVARRLGNTEPPTIVVNARDVTERRAMEDELRHARDSAERASRVKSHFLATMSHEIRTPMHAILGMAELLQQTPLNTEQQGYVHTFHSAGRHLLELLDDILDFSRIEAGGLQLASTPFELGELIDDIVALLLPTADAKGLELRIELGDGIGTLRLGDPQRLRQVIVNLLGNAIKFTDRGYVQLRVAADPAREGTVQFTIKDTGIGIAPEHQATLFTPFTQLNSGYTRTRGGTGLGLSICHRLIEAMGGALTVDSTPGQGSVFRFAVTLPTSARQGEPTAPASSDDATMPALPQASLLVADDSEMNRLVIKEFLRDTPCQITFAENGVEAIELFERQPFDMVLMDIQMPLLDGWSATRHIRAHEARHAMAPTPIIALTASAMEEDRRASLAAGCTTFCAKPIGKEQLLKLIRQQLAPAGADTAASG